tara:strand:+ start:78 stop:257 length:180 start_codon:yes stop_codon:yes gene_type:complete
VKIGDLIRDEDDDLGVIVELDDVVARVVVYYAGLTNVMSDEEKHHWMWEDQIKVICEAR